MADNDPNTPDGEAPLSPAKNRKLIVIVAAAVLLLGGGGAGAWFFLLAPGGGEAAETAEGPDSIRPVEYLAMTPAFIVNFPYQGRQRFLQATVTVMSRDPEALAAVTEHMPVIRHNLINLFSAQMLTVAEAPESGIEALRALATREVQEVLIQEIGRPGIDEVLFEAFVMQ